MPLSENDCLFWDCLVILRDELRSMQFVSMEANFPKAITNPEAICIRKIRREREHESGQENTLLPGMIITPGNQSWDPKAGTDRRDDAIYEAVVQIVVKDNHLKETGLRTVLKWQDQIRRRLNQNVNESLWPSDSRGTVAVTYVTSINTLDERFWVPHRLFAGGVYIRWKARETRDSRALSG